MNRATGVRWRVLALLVLVSFVSYVLRSDVSIASTAIVEDLGLTEQQLGYIFAAFAAGYTIFQFPGGVFGLKLGARRAMTIIMVLWGLLIMLTAAAGSITASTTTVIAAFIGVRFLVGAAHAPIYPLTGAVIERWFPIGSWALPNGLSSTGLTLGYAAVAPALAVMVVAFGWQASFVMLGPLAFVGAVLWWLYVRDEPRQHASVNDAEAALIVANRPDVVAAHTGQPGWLRVLKNRDVLLLTLAYFCMNYVFYLMFNWVFYYLAEVRGFDAAAAGFFTSVQWIAAAIGATLGGFLCDFLCRRKGMRLGCARPAMVALFLSGTFVLAGALIDNAYIAVGCLALSFLCNQVTEAAFWAAGISIGGRNAGAACGVMNTGGNSAGIVFAPLVPFIADKLGWTTAIATGALFAFLGAALWLFIRADRPEPA
ncbi:MAG TPA: MFS transporter [Woeseiaceae bacterium]|nr:MFS transporter [Woeseiaceae bacterium]